MEDSVIIAETKDDVETKEKISIAVAKEKVSNAAAKGGKALRSLIHMAKPPKVSLFTSKLVALFVSIVILKKIKFIHFFA